mgnify:CR=1 FL=1
MKRSIATAIFCTFVVLSGCTNKPEESASDGRGESGDVALTEQEMENLVKRSWQYVAMYNVNNKGAIQYGGWNIVDVDTKLKDHTLKLIARPKAASPSPSLPRSQRGVPEEHWLPRTAAIRHRRGSAALCPRSGSVRNHEGYPSDS